MLPNFLIIGAQKGGTTSLINHLARHPDIFVPYEKEIGFFHDDQEYAKGIDYYKTYFSGWNGEKCVGHAPVNTSFCAEKAAPRLFSFNPDIRLIMILRNPIDRAYSHYYYCRRNCLEDMDTFEAVIQRELDMIARGDHEYRSCHFYISHGFYYAQLRAYFEYFDRNQLLILYYEDFKHSPESTLLSIHSFLKVEAIKIEELDKKHNPASAPKYKFIQKVVFKDNLLKSIYKRIIPDSIQISARRYIIDPLMKKNLKRIKYEPIQPETRELLRQIFKQPNEELARLLKRDFSDWQ